MQQLLGEQAAGKMIVCSYTGIHFVNVLVEKVGPSMSLNLHQLIYKTDQFVNRVLEYTPGKFLAASWDNSKFIFIDHETESILTTIEHPVKGVNMRCWGLAKVSDFDIIKCPYVFARDNTGILLINVQSYKVHRFSESPITVNLFGHGEVL